jgi:2-polyprenyl-3-methyl-5-hydroxy-6-metoxy-1,4-benzoquinol methylase
MSFDLLTDRERRHQAHQGEKGESSPQNAGNGVCRVCGGVLHRFIDLGMSPLCDRLLKVDQLQSSETFYPLDIKICGRCWLAQHHEYVAPTQIYRDYAYSSSVSASWLAHARAYVDEAVRRFALGLNSLVVEIGSNDGYLLRNVMERGIPCLGIDPARIAGREAQRTGIPTISEFFTDALASTLAKRGMSADLIVANNVVPEISDLNDFAAGIVTLLKPDGVATIEVPHLMRVMERNEFDTMYHENLWYFSLHAMENVLAPHRLRVFDVEELHSQGGSLRMFCCRAGSRRTETPAVERVRAAEVAAGLRDVATYRAFEAKVIDTKRKLVEMLLGLKRHGDRIAAYGAPGKGNMLLSYCGIGCDILDFTVDRNPYKHGQYMPGTRIRVEPVERLYAERPDWVLILPWNFEQEIVAQLRPLRERGTKFIVPIPEPRIVG